MQRTAEAREPEPDAEVGDRLTARLRFYEAATETLVALVTTGAYWGDADQQHLWVNTIERLANGSGTAGGDIWATLQRCAAQRVFYVAGLGAIAGNHRDCCNGF